MTEEDRLVIRELKDRIQQLFKAYEQLEQEKEELARQTGSLQKQIEVLENEQAVLVGKYENLKLAKIFEAGYNDNQAARQKINKLLREIDKCMALLNE